VVAFFKKVCAWLLVGYLQARLIILVLTDETLRVLEILVKWFFKEK
jgi:hypothetical protein